MIYCPLCHEPVRPGQGVVSSLGDGAILHKDCLFKDGVSVEGRVALEAPAPAKPKRYREALAIQLGACNPSGIAISIVAACKEAREEGISGRASDDPAVRLMVHQLAFICNTAEIDAGSETYSTLIKECENHNE